MGGGEKREGYGELEGSMDRGVGCVCVFGGYRSQVRRMRGYVET